MDELINKPISDLSEDEIKKFLNSSDGLILLHRLATTLHQLEGYEYDSKTFNDLICMNDNELEEYLKTTPGFTTIEIINNSIEDVVLESEISKIDLTDMNDLDFDSWMTTQVGRKYLEIFNKNLDELFLKINHPVKDNCMNWKCKYNSHYNQKVTSTDITTCNRYNNIDDIVKCVDRSGLIYLDCSKCKNRNICDIALDGNSLEGCYTFLGKFKNT